MGDLIDKMQGAEDGLEQGDALKKHAGDTLVRRVSALEDVASMVSFRASRDSVDSTGHTMLVDGGIRFARDADDPISTRRGQQR